MLNVTTICLGMVAHGDWTGYDIKRAFESGSFSHFFEASYGSIYPALAALEADGLVTSRTETQDGRPNRKVYSITDAGHIEFTARIRAHTPQPDKFRSEFLIAMLFATELGEERVDHILNEQIGRLEAELDAIEEQEREADPADPASAFVLAYGRHVLTASISFLKDNRHQALQAASARLNLAAAPTQTSIARLAGKIRS